MNKLHIGHLLGKALIIFSSLCLSCNTALEKAEYYKWIRDYDNGLHVKKSFSHFVFDVQYQPSQYLALLSNHSSLQGEDDLQYYTLKIGIDNSPENIIDYNLTDKNEKQRRLYYYAYLFQNDLFLEEGETRLPCVLFHFENSDLANNRTFILGFENPSKNSATESKLVIESDQLSSLPIKIKILKNNIPSLKL